MPSISKIRFTNVVYDGGEKRYNDEIFHFNGENGAILLENGGGKTVFIQAAIQAVLPHETVAGRDVKETLVLDGQAAHIAIEWIVHEKPKRYAVTAVTLFMQNQKLDSYRYAYAYSPGDEGSIEQLPFTIEVNGTKRAADKGEISDYYTCMKKQTRAQTFDTLTAFKAYIEEEFHIIEDEWRGIARINKLEGGVEAYFDGCESSEQLVDRLLIPTVDEALLGNQENRIADLFQKQREHLRQYNRLTEQIRESKDVNAQVQHYAGEMERMFQAEQKWEQAKKRARVLFDLTEKSKSRNEEMLREISKQEDALADKQREWKKKKRSLDMARLEQEASHRKEEHEEATQRLRVQQTLEEENEQRILQFEHAWHRHEQQVEEQRLQLLQEQLDAIDADPDIVDIREKLDDVAGQMHGYFATRLEQIAQIIREHEREKEQHRTRQQELKQEERTVTHELANAQAENKLLTERMKENNERMMHIRRNELNLSDTDDVADMQKQWKQQAESGYEQLEAYRQRAVQIEEEKERSRNRQQEADQEMRQYAEARQNASNRKADIEERMERLYSRYREYDRQARADETMYARQHSMSSTLHETIKKQEMQEEEALEAERRASRWYDEYQDAERFTADPALEEFVRERLVTKYPTVETGTAFVERFLNMNPEKAEFCYSVYPFWAASLVASPTDVGGVQEYVRKYEDKWTAPVFVLTTNEAKAFFQLETEAEVVHEDLRVVVPQVWKYVSGEEFKRWKEEQRQNREEARKKRKAIHEQLGKSKRLLGEITEFFADYPLENYQALIETIREYRVKHQGASDRYENELHVYKRLEIEEKALFQKRESLQEDIREVDRLIKTAASYIELDSQVRKQKSDQQAVEERLKKLARSSMRIERDLRETEEWIADAEHAIMEAKSQQTIVRSDPDYSKVKNERLAVPKVEIEVLRERYHYLKGKAEEKAESRESITRGIEETKKRQEIVQREVRRKEREMKERWGSVLPYISPDEAALEQCRSKVSSFRKSTAAANDKARDAYAMYWAAHTSYEEKRGDFITEFQSEPYCFHENFARVDYELASEREQTDRLLRDVQAACIREKNEQENIQQAYSKLLALHTVHSFAELPVEMNVLTEQEKLDYSYQRQEYVGKISNQLRDTKGDYETKKASRDKAAQRFLYFCQNSIRDPRLKRQTISGLEHRHSYPEIQEWMARLQNSIARGIALLETDRNEHDRDLQTFVDRIAIHVEQVRKELLEIPRRTRVRVEDTAREIYAVHVPEWEEQAGRSLIRAYVHECARRLESVRYRTEAGTEDTGKVRKEVEKWFDTKQLLRVVIENRPIRVRCRKVSNDRKLSNTFSTWEQSNKWSGGEKWSKNMALFLGVLDYIAEKKQHLNAAQKAKRVVILDNPFGKASSEHVLDPVFFIANQLGFQIIALTALAEGNFVRTYFPVVYSCRLRLSRKGSTSIMEAKSVGKARFLDSLPPNVKKVEDYQQMNFFGK